MASFTWVRSASISICVMTASPCKTASAAHECQARQCIRVGVRAQQRANDVQRAPFPHECVEEQVVRWASVLEKEEVAALESLRAAAATPASSGHSLPQQTHGLKQSDPIVVVTEVVRCCQSAADMHPRAAGAVRSMRVRASARDGTRSRRGAGCWDRHLSAAARAQQEARSSDVYVGQQRGVLPSASRAFASAPAPAARVHPATGAQGSRTRDGAFIKIRCAERGWPRPAR